MKTGESRGAGFPVSALLVNAVGGLFLAAGILGLFAPEVLGNVPALKDPTTAWVLLGVGIALDLGAAATIVGHLRSRRDASRSPQA